MTVKRLKYYQITTSGRTADIIIYGDITSWATDLRRWYGDDENIAEVSALQIIQDIKGLDVDLINVYINSYGGEVAEALAIYSALKRHPASVHTHCDGFACSAATIVFCAGDVRVMGSIALMMIHNCMSYLGLANSNEMRKAAEDNDKINQSSINAYMAVSNLSEDQIKAMMDDETWLTAEECLQYGFATEIADAEDQDTPQQSAFGSIREAILSNHGQTAGPVVAMDVSEVMQKLDQIIQCLQQIETDDPEPEEEEPVDDHVPEQNAGKKFADIFSFLTK